MKSMQQQMEGVASMNEFVFVADHADIQSFAMKDLLPVLIENDVKQIIDCRPDGLDNFTYLLSNYFGIAWYPESDDRLESFIVMHLGKCRVLCVCEGKGEKLTDRLKPWGIGVKQLSVPSKAG